MSYAFLFLAIVFEVIATLNLKASDQFTKIIPTLVLTFGYITSFYFYLTYLIEALQLLLLSFRRNITGVSIYSFYSII